MLLQFIVMNFCLVEPLLHFSPNSVVKFIPESTNTHSVLWHCLLGHVTHKTVSEMTYNVSSGTLNSTIPVPSTNIRFFFLNLDTLINTIRNMLKVKHACSRSFAKYCSDIFKVLWETQHGPCDKFISESNSEWIIAQQLPMLHLWKECHFLIRSVYSDGTQRHSVKI